jgi:hypothetical protein
VKALKEASRKIAGSLVSWVKNHTPKMHKFDVYDLIFLTSIIAYGLVFSYFTVLKHNSFRTFARALNLNSVALRALTSTKELRAFS